MRQHSPIPPLDQLKAQAKRLRARLDQDGDFINHAESLELIAHQFGFRDWNTLHAAAGNRRPPAPIGLGARVAGTYLGQPFVGEVIGVEGLSPGRARVTIVFDEAVDVVSFDSFSAFRQRISCVINDKGRTSEKTSNGRPQLEIFQ